MDGYRTVRNAAEAAFTERRSRFIGYICPVQTEAQALEFIARIRKKHPDATHNVYGYILREQNKTRYSDDGEPQGTAGLPVLQVLKNEQLTDVAVVATRYFGGVLLGGGGLVRAYTHTAKIAVDAGERVYMQPCDLCAARCTYPLYDGVLRLVRQAGAVVTDTQFTDLVEMSLYLPSDRSDMLQKALDEQTAGQVQLQKNGQKCMPVSLEKEV